MWLICQGTLGKWIKTASHPLTLTVERITMLLTMGRPQQVDATGSASKDAQVKRTRWLTHDAWHRKRGQTAMDDRGILPPCDEYALHDRLSSDDHKSGADLLCGAHPFCNGSPVVENEQQPWAQDMHDLQLSIAKAAHEWREREATSIPQPERMNGSPSPWLFSFLALRPTLLPRRSPPSHQ